MPQEDLFLESVRHEVAAVIMPQRQAVGGAGVDAVELVSHRQADGLKSFEGGPALGDMPTEQLGVPVLDDAEQPDLAVLDGGDLGVSRPKGFRLRPLSGRVGDWRAGLGRSLCSLLARSFVCECHTISAVPRFQPPPRRTQHADFPHCALLFASPQGLWDLSAFALTYILRLRSCKSMDAFIISSLPSLWSETLQTAGLLRSTGVTPPQRYCEPIRHPLAFDRLPG